VFHRGVDHRFFAGREQALRLLQPPPENCGWAKTQAVHSLIFLAPLASSTPWLAAWFPSWPPA
jgi:hypothetical protein